MIHDPVLAPVCKDCTDVVNQSLTLHFSQNVFAFVYENILPDCFFRGLYLFFSGVVRFSLTIHGVAQDLEPDVVHNIMSTFSSEACVLVHQRLAGLGTRSHLLAS